MQATLQNYDKIHLQVESVKIVMYAVLRILILDPVPL
jgi:hypothetical protein